MTDRHVAELTVLVFLLGASSGAFITGTMPLWFGWIVLAMAAMTGTYVYRLLR